MTRRRATIRASASRMSQTMDTLKVPRLGDDQLAHFIDCGFVRIDAAFSSETADAARQILWRDLPGCDPHDAATWQQPVIRLGMYSQEPFVTAANTSILHAAFDQLIGPARWLPCRSVGTFPVRFPSADDPGDTGWHIDVSFGTEHPDFMEWRANIASRGRALLMLMLFSDVGEDDAPTRLRVGSHSDVARQLASAGEPGLTLRELAAGDFGGSAHREEALATGPAGTVYLCHPFLVHSAQRHRGQRPRFIAQPPLLPCREPALRSGVEGIYPVEQATRLALDGR